MVNFRQCGKYEWYLTTDNAINYKEHDFMSDHCPLVLINIHTVNDPIWSSLGKGRYQKLLRVSNEK